jgi:disulfide oxidoreductase YuzD
METRKVQRKRKPAGVQWLASADDHDYPAAQSYLSLIFEIKSARALVRKLRRASISSYKAKDIFRASGLPLLGGNNSHVKKDQQRIQRGETLSPILMVRDSSGGKVIIADGYHRLCAVYTFDEDAIVPCKIV